MYKNIGNTSIIVRNMNNFQETECPYIKLNTKSSCAHTQIGILHTRGGSKGGNGVFTPPPLEHIIIKIQILKMSIMFYI